MELIISSRSVEKKLEAKRLRRTGLIPAILYSQGKEGEAIVVNANEFKKMLMRLTAGSLPTTIFTLKHDKQEKHEGKKEGKAKKGGHEVQAILKDIQYQITTYEPMHLDFEVLIPDVPVTVNVPVSCVGVVDCIGVKMGGALRQVIRFVRVRCLPKHIPSRFEVDVKDLNLGQAIRIENMGISEHVQVLADPRQAVAVIVKR